MVPGAAGFGPLNAGPALTRKPDMFCIGYWQLITLQPLPFFVALGASQPRWTVPTGLTSGVSTASSRDRLVYLENDPWASQLPSRSTTYVSHHSELTR